MIKRPACLTLLRPIAGPGLIAGLLLIALPAAMALANPFGIAGGAPASPPSSGGIIGWIFQQQAQFYRSLSALVRASKEDGSAVWSLLGLSFLYGVFHAAGPGHGKAVIASYLVANNETWKRGITLAFAASALQALVAIAVVTIGAIVLGVTAATMNQTVRVIEVTAYSLIVLIGLRLVWVKGRSFLRSWRAVPVPRSLGSAAAPVADLRISPRLQARFHCAACQTATVDGVFPRAEACDHDSAWGHAHGPEPADLAGPGGWKKGFAAIAAVGARPCSGAIIVLVFALALDLFWTGVASVLLMGFGTALTIAAIATLAVQARALAGRLAGASPGKGLLFLKGLEVAAAVVLVLFGVLLLGGYIASESMGAFGV